MNTVNARKKLLKEEKSTMAYLLDIMKGKNSLGYHFYYEYKRTELKEMIERLTEEEINKISHCETYKNIK